MASGGVADRATSSSSSKSSKSCSSPSFSTMLSATVTALSSGPACTVRILSMEETTLGSANAMRRAATSGGFKCLFTAARSREPFLTQSVRSARTARPGLFMAVDDMGAVDWGSAQPCTCPVRAPRAPRGARRTLFCRRPRTLRLVGKHTAVFLPIVYPPATGGSSGNLQEIFS